MKFSISSYKIALSILLHGFMGVSAQEITIQDLDSREPISNVIVYNRDRSKTALSDLRGHCNLSLFHPSERITIRHIGYQTKRTTPNQIVRKGNRVFLSVSPEELDEVVMSVSKWEQQKKDVPQKIAAIDARTIAFTNPQTSADVLQNSGKVFVQKSQLGGGSPMIRGFATNRLLLSVDGVRMNNAIFRGGNIQNVISIDPFTVRNTEIIFGPGSVIYGSDAIGGVMNFFTKKPQFTTSDSLHLAGAAKYRFATATKEQTGHLNLNIGKKKWAFLSSVTFNDFNDLIMGKNGPDSYLRDNYVQSENGTDRLVTNPDPEKQVPSAYNQISLMHKIAHKPNSHWSYDLGLFLTRTSDYSRYDRLIRPDDSGDGLRSAEWFYGPQEWFMGNFQLFKKGRGKFYDGFKLTTAYQHFEESRNERNFQDPIRYTTAESLNAYSANLDFENKKIGDLRLYYGGEYIFNKVGSRGSRFDTQTGTKDAWASRYPDGATWQTIAGYISAEYKSRPNITLLSGLRYSHVWIDAIFDTRFYPFPFNSAHLDNGALTASLGASWFPKANLQITLNGSTGFRSPNIDDVGKVFESEPGAVVVPNPNLDPEYAYNIELGVHKNLEDKVVLKGATFYTYLVDALVRRDYQINGNTQIMYNGALSNVQAIQNAARAYVYGFEFGVEAFITENFSLISNLTLIEGIEEDDDGVDSKGRHVPPTFGDVHLIWKNTKLQADLFLNYNGEIAYGDLALSERSKPYLYATNANGNPYSPSWYTLNLRTQYQLSNDLQLSAILENITDQRYRSYSSGIVAPGMNLILALAYRF